MQAGSYKLYSVKWKGIPNSDNAWITEKKLMKYIENSSKSPISLNPEFQNFLAMGRMMQMPSGQTLSVFFVWP
jgi:hypothetical protein